MVWGVAVLPLVLAATAIPATGANIIGICTHNADEQGECRRMRSIPPLSTQCNDDAGDDCVSFECGIMQDCITAVRNGQMDMMLASALGLWYLEQDYPETFTPVVAESRGVANLEQREDGLEYRVMALASREICEDNHPLTVESSQGLRSCHGQYGDLAGWVVPMAKLLSQSIGEVTEDSGNDLDFAEDFWTASCAPNDSIDNDEICTACATVDANGDCTMRDRYAGPAGVLQCLREQAGDIGFVDNWTVLGASQDGSDQQQNATLVNMGDFRAVCSDGCRPISESMESACYLAVIPSDILVMRADDDRIQSARAALVAAGLTDQFATTFGTSSNHDALWLSHGTMMLQGVTESTQDYLASLEEDLVHFSTLYSLNTDIPQNNRDGGNAVDEALGASANALTLWGIGGAALGFGIFIGVMIALCYHRTKTGAGSGSNQNPGGARAASKGLQSNDSFAFSQGRLDVPELNASGIGRHRPMPEQ